MSGRRDALVIGEALIDVVEHEGSAAGAVEHVGGSPGNVAVGLARLGHPVTLATHLGLDARGKRIRDALVHEGVRFSDASFRALRTSTARAVINVSGAARYDFDIDWQFEPPTMAPTLVHSGSIALFLEPGGASVAQYLAQLPPEVLVTIDPNVRPDLMPDHAEALARFASVTARANLVKLSDEDAQWLFPGLSPDRAAVRVLELGAPIVVVTLGAEGALAMTRHETLRVPSEPVRVVDTISAGDSFMAALISSFLSWGADGVARRLGTVLERAARAAAIAVSQAGANPPNRAQLDGH